MGRISAKQFDYLIMLFQFAIFATLGLLDFTMAVTPVRTGYWNIRGVS
jgi:hypothetical protein